MRHEINFQDAQQALGFIRPQLLRIETEVYQIRYPSFAYEQLMFVNTEGDMWDIGTIFYTGDIAGKAEWLSTKGFDMPFADSNQTQLMNRFHLAGIGYEWSLGELKRAEKLGRDLPSDKARAAKLVAKQMQYQIAIRGNTEKAMTGLINDTSVPTGNVPADGAGGGGSQTEFENKTPDQIMRDVNEVLNAPFNATKEIHIADTLGMPTSTLQYINGLRIGDGADTLRKYILENNAYTLQTGNALKLFGSRELETAGSSGTKRMMAYDRSREVLQYHLPGEHEFLPLFQKSSMTWEVGGIMNIGGVEIRLPKAMAYRDMI